jgi:hypothetical protein
MAEAGKAALQSGKDTPRGQDIIRPFEVEQLIDYLFYKGDDRGQDIRRMPLHKAYGTFCLPNCGLTYRLTLAESFGGILDYIRLPGHTETPTAKDVVCI